MPRSTARRSRPGAGGRSGAWTAPAPSPRDGPQQLLTLPPLKDPLVLCATGTAATTTAPRTCRPLSRPCRGVVTDMAGIAPATCHQAGPSMSTGPDGGRPCTVARRGLGQTHLHAGVRAGLPSSRTAREALRSDRPISIPAHLPRRRRPDRPRHPSAPPGGPYPQLLAEPSNQKRCHGARHPRRGSRPPRRAARGAARAQRDPGRRGGEHEPARDERGAEAPAQSPRTGSYAPGGPRNSARSPRSTFPRSMPLSTPLGSEPSRSAAGWSSPLATAPVLDELYDARGGPRAVGPGAPVSGPARLDRAAEEPLCSGHAPAATAMAGIAATDH